MFHIEDDLSGDGDFIVVLVTDGALFLVPIVKGDGDGGLGDSSLTALVDELLKVGGPHVTQVGDAQEEADGIQDVGLATAVEAGDGVEHAK